MTDSLNRIGDIAGTLGHFLLIDGPVGMGKDLTGKRETQGDKDSGKVYSVEPGRKKQNEQEVTKPLENYRRMSLPITWRLGGQGAESPVVATGSGYPMAER